MCVYMRVCMYLCMYLLPIGGEEKRELGVGSIPVAVLPSSQDVKTAAL